jgi:glutamyl-tRNA synthetase
VFDREEAVSLFELSRVTKKAAVFDMDKCNHINQGTSQAVFSGDAFCTCLALLEGTRASVESHSAPFSRRHWVLMGGRGQTTRELAEYSDTFFPSLRWSPDISRPISIRKNEPCSESFSENPGLDVWNVSSMKK